MRKLFVCNLILLIILTACKQDSVVDKEVAKIYVNFEIERFDSAFYKASIEDLYQLKADYPFLFPESVPDSDWVAQLTDSINNLLLKEVQKVYPNLNSTKEDLKLLFKHLKYYKIITKVPRVITLTNNVDYRTKNIVNDSLVLIPLDNYLGPNHEFYQNFPKYIAANMAEKDIIPNIAESYAELLVRQKEQATFLDKMIYYGKLHYFKDVTLPFINEEDRIGYTKNQLEWARANESPIWGYFIEKELLFSTDTNLNNRFIAEAPYSKFYLHLDNESPGRLGQYIGWQIVRAYADATGKDLLTILRESPEVIFKKSRFKPKQ